MSERRSALYESLVDELELWTFAYTDMREFIYEEEMDYACGYEVMPRDRARRLTAAATAMRRCLLIAVEATEAQ